MFIDQVRVNELMTDRRLFRATPSRKQFGKLLRDTRKAAGLTQMALSQRLGTDRPTISDWELGKQNVTVDMMHKLIDACGKQLVIDAKEKGKK